MSDYSSKAFKAHTFEYEFEGKQFMFELFAESRDEAMRRLVAIQSSTYLGIVESATGLSRKLVAQRKSTSKGVAQKQVSATPSLSRLGARKRKGIRQKAF